MRKENKMEYKEKIANPTKFYRHPEEVKKDISLDLEDKIKLLENWLDDIKLNLIAKEKDLLEADGNQNYTKEIEGLLAVYNTIEAF